MIRDENDLKRILDEAGIPAHMREGIELYFWHGIPPGGFMTNILANDFVSAACCADDTNQHALWNYAKLLYHLPMSCWGSEARVSDWIKVGGAKGMMGVKA